MHYGRITTAIGAVLGIIGLGLVSASSAAEDMLPDLNAATGGAIPAGFDRVLISLWDESAVGGAIFLIALAVVLGVSLIPDIKDAISRMNALVVTVLGVTMLAIGAIATMGALDDADTLEAGLSQATGQAFTVSISFGWYLLVVAGVLAAIGGVLQLMARPDESALSE